MYDPHEPLFAFGHGLSYTTFDYSDLKLSKSSIKDGQIVDVTVNVKNTGSVDSDEVIQLYVGFPESQVERPHKALKGFKRIYIPAGETKRITIALDPDELKYWNEDNHAFVLEKGQVELMIGAASNDIRLTGNLDVK